MPALIEKCKTCGLRRDTLSGQPHYCGGDGKSFETNPDEETKKLNECKNYPKQ